MVHFLHADCFCSGCPQEKLRQATAAATVAAAPALVATLAVTPPLASIGTQSSGSKASTPSLLTPTSTSAGPAGPAPAPTTSAPRASLTPAPGPEKLIRAAVEVPTVPDLEPRDVELLTPSCQSVFATVRVSWHPLALRMLSFAMCSTLWPAVLVRFGIGASDPWCIARTTALGSTSAGLEQRA